MFVLDVRFGFSGVIRAEVVGKMTPVAPLPMAALFAPTIPLTLPSSESAATERRGRSRREDRAGAQGLREDPAGAKNNDLHLVHTGERPELNFNDGDSWAVRD